MICKSSQVVTPHIFKSRLRIAITRRGMIPQLKGKIILKLKSVGSSTPNKRSLLTELRREQLQHYRELLGQSHRRRKSYYLRTGAPLEVIQEKNSEEEKKRFRLVCSPDTPSAVAAREVASIGTLSSYT